MTQRKNNRKMITAAAALLVCLALLCPITAFAAGGTADITDNGFNVDVDIAWGDMEFTYSPQRKLWDPAEHDYKTLEAGWTVRGNDITVTNVGEHAVRADFSAVKNEAATDVTVGFKTAENGEAEANLSVELAGASGGIQPSQTIYFDISGEISQAYNELATVTVTIIAK